MGHKLRLLRLAFWLCNSSATGSCCFFFKSGMWTNMHTTSLGSYPVAADLSVRCMKWWSALRWTWLWELHLRGFQWSWILAVEPVWHVWALIYVWPWHDPWFAEARFVHILAPTVGIACCLVKGLKRFEDVWIHRFKKIEVAITLTLRPKPKNGRASNWHYFNTQRQASS